MLPHYSTSENMLNNNNTFPPLQISSVSHETHHTGIKMIYKKTKKTK